MGGKTIKVKYFKALYNKFTVTKVRDVYKEIVYIINIFINFLVGKAARPQTII